MHRDGQSDPRGARATTSLHRRVATFSRDLGLERRRLLSRDAAPRRERRRAGPTARSSPTALRRVACGARRADRRAACTRARAAASKPSGIDELVDGLRVLPPFGFFDFVALERDAACVLTDSGTVQEECCIFDVANVTMRDVTERPETVECGSNIIAASIPDRIAAAVRVALQRERNWTVPPEYLAPAVSDTVVKILLERDGRVTTALVLRREQCRRQPPHDGGAASARRVARGACP